MPVGRSEEGIIILSIPTSIKDVLVWMYGSFKTCISFIVLAEIWQSIVVMSTYSLLSSTRHELGNMKSS